MHSTTFTAHWRSLFDAGEVISSGSAFTLTVDPALPHDRRVMILTETGGAMRAVVTPAIAASLALPRETDDRGFHEALRSAGHTLHDPDYLFAFTEDELAVLRTEAVDPSVRRLDEADAALFAEFESSASEQDLDDAYVELDHWAVFGAVADGRLVSAASMYPWNDALIADTGVLTLPPFRGSGHARRVVRAISAYADSLGYAPQYRCQLDNAASIALATRASLTLFGTWQAISPSSP